SQRIQQWAERGETVVSAPTYRELTAPLAAEALPARLVKGSQTPVAAYRVAPATRPLAARRG
ncbi:MAG: hypothetical protein ACR2KP_15375, partial [Egibacteraceae bacterium]